MNWQQQKEVLIVTEVVNASMTMRHTAAIASPPKRIFRAKDRRPLKRIRKREARFWLTMQPMMSAMSIASIIQLPILKFEKGHKL